MSGPFSRKLVFQESASALCSIKLPLVVTLPCHSLLIFLGFWCFVVCGLSAIICEICGRLLGFHLSNIDWVSLDVYSPADYADDAEERSKLHYFAEKDRLGWWWVLCGSVVLWFVCVNLRDQRETLGFRLSNIDWVRLRVILPQITQITQRNAASCIITQRKTVSWG